MSNTKKKINNSSRSQSQQVSTNINVYTDGSFIKKGHNIYCGYGIYFSGGEYKSISRKFTHEPITNNRAELYAILKSVILCNKIDNRRRITNRPRIKSISIYSDSEYCVKIFNEWYIKWKKTNKDYLNKDIIDEIADHITNASFKIYITHVHSHTNKNDPHSVANNIADGLAKKGALGTAT
ncbi:MAG: ribonuclease H [Gaeavirus sp.]|uniref:ribonuclease H n=1 Tax=Gaeavirus sp. TaxID=2487767 RepID=A0A3G5A0C6_9VIRU|nr:MAG: ribonuclease H [Gaeavirus sp.]